MTIRPAAVKRVTDWTCNKHTARNGVLLSMDGIFIFIADTEIRATADRLHDAADQIEKATA